MLKVLRNRAVLSQQDLADRAGVAKRTIVNLEVGRTTAHPSTVRKLADALGVEPTALVEPPQTQ
jgi:DNA-binding XRE family transcriptional regulator